MKASIVMAYVVDSSDNLLLLHRNDRDEREPVKGGIENNESFEETMRRELYEETGLTEKDILSMKTVNGFPKGFIGEYFLLHCHEIRPEISLNHVSEVDADHDSYKRIGLDELDQFSMYGDSAKEIKTIFHKKDQV